ncbi:MAG: TIGR00341 family protein [Chitinophagaceae bacterium]
MSNLFADIRKILSDRFNLHEDKEDEDIIIENITRNVEFKGTNLWALVFAIFIASIGLNVNSTAVIIGAMLVSPLMGPIMGIGLSIGILELPLVRKAIKNLLIAAFISIAASAIYFLITPLHNANSELLARTTPSLWDVLIAFFGGLAGIVAGTRKQTSNVIPGVAIATALMPPLCTAGFGLATGNLFYFLGALYLFFINSICICFATFIIVRFLKFNRHQFADKKLKRKVNRYLLLLLIISIPPSGYLAYRIVDKSVFENNARKFVQASFTFKQTQVINRVFKYNPPNNSIELLLIGNNLTQQQVDSIKGKLKSFNLAHTNLVIRQGLNAKQEIDFAQIKASILEEVFSKQNEPDTIVETISKLDRPIPDIKKELAILYPALKEYSLSNTIVNTIESTRADTILLFFGKFSRPISGKEKDRLKNWLLFRVKADSIEIR